MFRAKVESDSGVLNIRRLSDDWVFNDCYVCSQGAQSWAPKKKDIVMAEVGDDGFCYIFARLQDQSPISGTQTGDADKNNGILVSEDGKVIQIASEMNDVVIDEDGISVNAQRLEIKGDGYTRTHHAANETSDTNLVSKISETLKCPGAITNEWSCVIEADMAGKITVTRIAGTLRDYISDNKRYIGTTEATTGYKSVIKGEDFIQAIMDQVVEILRNHVHKYVSPTGPLMTDVSTGLAAITWLPKPSLDAALSKIVFIE